MTSRLSQMQARFQQRQMQEKEEKLLKLYENQQQRAFDKVGRNSAGNITSYATGAGKVRQMFDERRQKAGIDRSYPLEPLKNSNARTVSLDRKVTTTTTTTTKTNKIARNGGKVSKKEAEEYENVDYEAENYLRQHRTDLVTMMNNHNLGDSLEDEVMPQIGFDEVDDGFIGGKLANVGGKLPSQNGAVKKASPGNATESKKSVVRNAPVKNKSPPAKPPPVQPRTPSSGSSSGRGSATPKHSAPTSPVKMSSGKPPQPRLQSSNRKPPTARPPNNAVQRDDLNACRFCQRRFAQDRIQVHEDICSRTAKKKRKAYDATKHRVTGTELEPYVKKTSKQGSFNKNPTKVVEAKSTNNSKKKPVSAKSNWRQKHEEFISAIRAAKMAQAHVAKGGNLKDLPPPPPSTNPDYVQCPHCGRRFNEAAAQRHIPKCATYEYNKPKGGSRR